MTCLRDFVIYSNLALLIPVFLVAYKRHKHGIKEVGVFWWIIIFFLVLSITMSSLYHNCSEPDETCHRRCDLLMVPYTTVRAMDIALALALLAPVTLYGVQEASATHVFTALIAGMGGMYSAAAVSWESKYAIQMQTFGILLILAGSALIALFREKSTKVWLPCIAMAGVGVVLIIIHYAGPDGFQPIIARVYVQDVASFLVGATVLSLNVGTRGWPPPPSVFKWVGFGITGVGAFITYLNPIQAEFMIIHSIWHFIAALLIVQFMMLYSPSPPSPSDGKGAYAQLPLALRS